MASVMNMKESREFCDDVYYQLDDIKEKIIKLRNLSAVGSPTSDSDGGKFVRQLNELADIIDWKLQILSHSCSYDWRGASEYQGNVQVDEMDRAPDSDNFAGGYIGG